MERPVDLAVGLHLGRSESVMRQQPGHDAQQIRISGPHASTRDRLAEKQGIPAGAILEAMGAGS